MVFRLEFLCTYLHITVASGSQLASGSNLRCSHESPSQTGIAIFWRGLPCLAPVSRNVGQVRCVGANVSRRSLIGTEGCSGALCSVQNGILKIELTDDAALPESSEVLADRFGIRTVLLVLCIALFIAAI